jgi:vancomycin permeability regulator SanA
MNKDPFESISGINWDKYNYSVLLVPGEGPSVEGVNIDPKSINRCKLAAQKYNEGVVPFILVSGGHVHPNKTPYSEAVEMKKYLVNDLNIPGRAVIIDPHARHTTTNMRNAARIVYKFNLPADKKILITTDSLQNAFLLNMERRFKMELGCLPYRDLKKLDVESSEYYPVRNTLQVNSLDPLDP